MAITTAFESKILKGFSKEKIFSELEKDELKGSLVSITEEIKFVTEDCSASPFQYPLISPEGDKVYVDARSFTSVDRNGELKIRNSLDEQLNILLAQLELAWVKNDRADMAYRTFSTSTQVMVRWLTDAISHNYGLSPYQKSKLMALVAMYGVGQFYNNVEDESTIQRHLQTISRNYPITIDMIQEVAVSVENKFPRDIDEFMEALMLLDLGPRLANFNAKSLYTAINGSWWHNTNSNILVALALEYPPAMGALTKFAFENSMYKRCKIGQVVDTMKRGSVGPDFVRSVLLFID